MGIHFGGKNGKTKNAEHATRCAPCGMYTLDTKPGSGKCMVCGAKKR